MTGRSFVSNVTNGASDYSLALVREYKGVQRLRGEEGLVETSCFGWGSRLLPRMQTGTFEATQSGTARWPEMVVKKSPVLPADFGVNLSLLAAHTASSL